MHYLTRPGFPAVFGSCPKWLRRPDELFRRSHWDETGAGTAASAGFLLSWPDLFRPSTFSMSSRCEAVDARDKRGHDQPIRITLPRRAHSHFKQPITTRGSRHTPRTGLAFGEPDDRLQRSIQYAETSRSPSRASLEYWIARFRGRRQSRVASRNTPPRFRGAKRPGCKSTSSLKSRGRRESRVPAAPAASRAKMNKAHEHSHRWVCRSPAFPAQWF